MILAKVMKEAKEIRSGDKKRVKTGVKTPINRRPGWVPGGFLPAAAGLSGRRRGKEGGPPPGLAVLSVVARSPGRWSAGGGLLGGLLGG